ncbi:MAG: ABC transporter substrate-binding protein, partial [Anaerolineae bacterium]
MKTLYKLFALLLVLSMIVSCGATEAPPPTEEPEPEPTQAEVAPTEAPEPEPTEAEVEPEGEPLVVGLMTDKSGALAVYGPSQTQGFYLGLEYATNGT